MGFFATPAIYNLSAQDANGNEWSAKNVRVIFTGLTLRIVTHSLTLISSRGVEFIEPALNEAALTLGSVDYVLPNEQGRKAWLNHVANSPISLDYEPAAIFDIEGFDISISRDKYKNLTVTVASEKEITEAFISCLYQSLRFVYGRTLDRQAYSSKTLETRTLTTELQRHVSGSRTDPSIAPIRIDRGHEPEDFWRLFELFLRYVIAPQPSDHDYILQSVWSVNEAWYASIDSIGLLIAVAVEGVLREKFSKYGMRSNELASDILAIIPCIDEADINPRSKARIKGLLPTNESRFYPAEALERLAEMGMVPAHLVELWMQVRNKRAHGQKHNLQDIAGLRKLTGENYYILQLYYYLVYFVIGYYGKYTDYSQPDFPENDLDKVEL